MSRKTKKVILVTPPYHCGVVESAGTWLNLAFVYLAGSLRARGHDVVIYDAMSKFHTHAQIEATLRTLEPDVVASTAITATYLDAVEVLRTAKRLSPEVVTVLGNVHPTFLWEETLREQGDAVEFVVRHEGEETLPELLEALSTGTDPIKVRGIAFNKDGHPIATPSRPQIPDLDTLVPAWDLVEWPIYSYRPEPGSTLAIVSSSRGCNQGCSFCSQQRLWDRRWRARTPASFVAELEHLHATYGVNVAMLSDETPTIGRERWHALIDLLIERKLPIKLLMETRVDDILRDKEILPRYREAGISHVYVGVESPHQEDVDIFKKNIKVEDSRQAIALMNEVGIVTETSFVMGMPNETPEKIQRTIELALHYAPDMAFFLAIAPWPYAELWHDLEPYVATRDYRRYNLVEPVVKPTAMTLAELHEHLDVAHMRFYMNKMANLGKMSPEKRHFMQNLMHLLIRHSYLGDKMRAIAAKPGALPPEMAAMFQKHARAAH